MPDLTPFPGKVPTDKIPLGEIPEEASNRMPFLGGSENTAPVLQTTALEADENQLVAGLVLATDDDGDTLTYSLTGNGADDVLFTIDPDTGALSFIDAPDFEAPSDADGDGIYEVEVQVDDGKGGTTAGTVQVTVQDVNDAPVLQTTVLEADENQTAAGLVLATDQDGDTLTYALTGNGADDALLIIDANTGALSFLAAPDFESPNDADGDGIYEVEVEVDDGNGGITTGLVQVTVQNVNDAPVLQTTELSAYENQRAAGLVLLTSSDGPIFFSLTGNGADDALFTFPTFTSSQLGSVLMFTEAPDFENPADADGDGVYEVEVQVSDNRGITTGIVQITVLDVNEPAGAYIDAFVGNIFVPFGDGTTGFNQVLFNDGSGSLISTSSPPATTSGLVVLGDLNGDGHLDAFVSGFWESPSEIWLNNGDGSFILKSAVPGTVATNTAALGDLDGDGHLDIFLAHTDFNLVLLNDGSGNLTLAPNLPGANYNSRDVALGDLNGNGHLDAFVVNGGSQAPIQIYLNDGSGNFTVTEFAPLPNGYRDVALGDIDGDGDLDAFVVWEGGDVRLLLNDGSGAFTFSPWVKVTLPDGDIIFSSVGFSDVRSVALGDLDGDGDLDLFIAGDEFHRVYFNDGGGHFSNEATLYFEAGNLAQSSVALADLDRDGDLDAFVSNAIGPNQVLLNNGSGIFTLAPIQPDDPIDNSFGVALGDLDGDGPIPPVDEHGLPNINPDGLLPSMYADIIV